MSYELQRVEIVQIWEVISALSLWCTVEVLLEADGGLNTAYYLRFHENVELNSSNKEGFLINSDAGGIIGLPFSLRSLYNKRGNAVSDYVISKDAFLVDIQIRFLARDLEQYADRIYDLMKRVNAEHSLLEYFELVEGYWRSDKLRARIRQDTPPGILKQLYLWYIRNLGYDIYRRGFQISKYTRNPNLTEASPEEVIKNHHDLGRSWYISYDRKTSSVGEV